MEINNSSAFRPLKGIRVLDLADDKASFCSKLLADLGASVVKVEKPGGDPSRNIGPFSPAAPTDSRSLFFTYHNTNKRGITLDITEKEGKRSFLRLLQRYDIVVEAFPPGHLDRLGLGYDVLSQTNSRLILASITGFGQKGPRSRYKSCAIVASAYGGQMHISGSPSTPPLAAFGEQPYFAASLFAAIGILLALRKLSQGGKGEHIDISLQEAVLSTLDHVMVRYFYDEVIPQRTGGQSWNNDFCILPCKDGHILLTLSQQWETLIGWMEAEGMAEDLREDKWKDERHRLIHGQAIRDAVGRWTQTHTRNELFELAQLMRLPWAPVCSPEETVESPQLQARSFFLQEFSSQESASGNPKSPYRFNGARADRPKRAPLIGEHNPEIYRDELGLTDQELKSLCCSPVSFGRPQPNRGILDGLRVLDFTWMLAGPYATRILADFGAEVIKVQSRKTATGAESNLTGYFNTWNRNKCGITLDLSRPEARDIVLKLTKMSDVVIENFSPRVMPNWGLSYDNLKEVKPDLIMASASAMGQDGPWRDFVAFGPTLQALSGLTYLTSFDKDAPMGVGYAYADTMIGLYVALAVLSALEHRDKTGQGQYIDISGFETVCTLLGPVLMDAKVNQRDAVPQGNHPDHIPAAPYGCYRCLGTDRWCVIAVFTEDEWRAFGKLAGNPPWMKEDKFSTLSGRKEHLEELDKRLEEWTAQHPCEEVVRLLQEAGVPAGVVQNAEDIAHDPHLAANAFFEFSDHPILGKVFSDRSPIKLEKATGNPWKPAPLLGEDNRYVFRNLLGFSEDEFASYVERGIVG